MLYSNLITKFLIAYKGKTFEAGTFHCHRQQRNNRHEGNFEAEDASITLPVMQEEIQVGKRRKETARVRISKRGRSSEELVDVPLEEETVSVRKIPTNRFVDGPVPVRHEGDTLIVPLLKEVLVIEKKLLLREEWHIRKDRSTPQHC